MAKFVIQGGKQLSGTIAVGGSKNAALPLLAATLLTKQPVTLHTIPRIRDVEQLITMLQAMGAAVARDGNTITVAAENIDPTKLPTDQVSHLRGSILLLGALVGRCKTIELPLPGGDIIGARPIDVHTDAFRQMGGIVTEKEGIVLLDGTDLKPSTVTLRQFSVTATENVMLAAATLPGITTIHIAATEPHVVALANLLTKLGAKVEGAGTHTITVTGSSTLGSATADNIFDMLEAGLFVLLAAATKSELTIENVPANDLKLFFKKLDDIGVVYTIDGTTVHVEPSVIRPFRVQTLPQPGIATDLQAPFAVMATQATGTSLIHDPMYESRFRHCDELVKMGASVTVCDPHRVVIEGPTPLRGHHIKSLDIRSGATLIMAGLIAEGETVIDDAEIIDRGYEDLAKRLQAVGADIKRVEDMVDPVSIGSTRA